MAGERIKDFHVFDFDFHDHPADFEPDDEIDFEFCMTITVGDGHAGSNYQVHVCTPLSLPRLEEKRAIYLIDRWPGQRGLIDGLNARIAKVIEDARTHDPFHALARQWLWEYGGE